MKTRLTIAVVLCALLTACATTSLNPLSSPDIAQPDPKLLGTWHPKEDPSELYTFRVKNTHWMRIMDKKAGKSPEFYDAFVTIIGHDRYLNVVNVQKDDKGKVTGTSYYLMRYAVSGHTFSTWWIDQDKAANLVRSGQLKGTVEEDKPPAPGSPADLTVHLTDSTEKIVVLLQMEGPRALYRSKSDDFVRIGP